MAIQRVSEIEGEPVVGRFYLVPCVYESGWQTGWRPVYGPQHDDADLLAFPWRHWHYDHRFTSGAQLWEMGLGNERIERALGFVASNAAWTSAPEWRRRKCRRQMPEFPAVERLRVPLEAAYKDASAKCGRCPHRGFSLKGLPVKDGKVICPGHGLRWNVNTGEMVPRC